MENIIDSVTGKPIDKTYLEYNLPPILEEDLKKMKWVLKEMDKGVKYPKYWDCHYLSLQSSINMCAIENLISEEQAKYLRVKYLGFNEEDV